MSTDAPRFTDRSAQSRAAILAAARARFAADGYEKTTIRAVAADAGIDASMVMRYYGNKARLFQASAAVDLELPAPAAVSPQELAAGLARAFVEHWEKGENEVERLVVRTAVTHPEAVAQVQRIFETQLRPPFLAALPDDPDAELRAALVMTQTIGMIVCRYLLALEPIASADPQVLERALRDVVELHATREL
ncbi:MAG TPA: TetR family transcriptional regulator [Actinocrinis sp.]|nr:TetR family transcriptional regulator [Actinocrinis sp.]